mgnify:CR=1 FL=1
MSLRPSNNQLADVQRDLTDVVSIYPGERVSYPFHVLKVNPLDTSIVIDMVVESADDCKVGDVVTQVIMKDQLQYSVHGQVKSIDGNRIQLMYTSNGIAFRAGKAISGAKEISIVSCESPYQIFVDNMPSGSCTMYLMVPPNVDQIDINSIPIRVPKSPCTLLYVENAFYTM